MKRFTTIKTLLVALCAMGTTGVWGQEPTTLYYKAISDWSEDDLTEWVSSVSTGVTFSSEANTGLTFSTNAGNNSGSAGKLSKTLVPSSKSIIQIDAVWNTGSATGQNNSSQSYLTIGDVTLRLYGQNKLAQITIGDKTTDLSGGDRDKDWTISITINQLTKKVTGTVTVNTTQNDISGITKQTGNLNLALGIGGKIPNWANSTTLKSIRITETELSADEHNYAVSAVANSEEIASLGSGIAAEDEVYSIIVPKVIGSNGKYYSLVDQNVTSGYSASFQMGTADTEEIVEYAEDDAIAYYAEGESATGEDSKFSNGGWGHVNAQNVQDRGITFKLAPGVYKLVARVHYSDRYRAINIRNKSTMEILGNILGSNSSQNDTELESDEFQLNVTTEMVINGANSDAKTNQSGDFDYVMVIKTQDVPVATATIGTSGYATFASEYDLDLSHLPKGLKAYTAAVSGTSVNFTEVTTAVPAFTGLLLEGTAGTTYEIPVAESATAVSGNEFLVNTTGATIKSTADTYYFALKAGSDLQFAKISESGVVVPATKAYLKVAATNFTAAEARLTATFGGATAVKALDTVAEAGSAVYSLSGQRVGQPTKGLYVKDGRKIIIK